MSQSYTERVKLMNETVKVLVENDQPKAALIHIYRWMRMEWAMNETARHHAKAEKFRAMLNEDIHVANLYHEMKAL